LGYEAGWCFGDVSGIGVEKKKKYVQNQLGRMSISSKGGKERKGFRRKTRITMVGNKNQRLSQRTSTKNFRREEKERTFGDHKGSET